jgi:pSer/pThr/pTyr-binding forkhead associated (FHA) protein
MLPCLVSLDGLVAFYLEEPLTLIGRDSGSEIRLESSRVSRRHCFVTLASETLLVRDLGSTNGTWINGRRVDRGRLIRGDVLGIGHLRFRLEFRDRANSPPQCETRLGDDSTAHL